MNLMILNSGTCRDPDSPRLRPQQGRANHRYRVKLSSYLEPTVIQTASSNLEQELQGGKLKSSRGRGVRTPREQFPPKFPQFLGGFRYLFAFQGVGDKGEGETKPLEKIWRKWWAAQGLNL